MTDGTHADEFNHLRPKKMQYSATGAARDNTNKPKLSLVPVEVLEAVSTVLYKSSIEGGGKYEKHNWKKGDKYSTPLDSLLRHAYKLSAGETNDPESGLPHSWHIACNAAFLVYYEKHYPANNDFVVQARKAPQAPSPTQQPQGTSIDMKAVAPMLGMLMTALSNNKKAINED